MEKKEVILSPIEVAIDEMTAKVIDIREVVDLVMPDMKKLQLRLQGSVSAQVSSCWPQLLMGTGNVKVIWLGKECWERNVKITDPETCVGVWEVIVMMISQSSGYFRDDFSYF